MRPVMRSALGLSLLAALGGCFGTQDLKLGELESRDPPKHQGEPMSEDGAAPADAETPPRPPHQDDEGEEHDDARDAAVAQVAVDAAADAAIAARDAGVVDAGAVQDAMLSTDAGSDAASDSGRADAGDAGDAGGDAGDAGDSGRGSLLCTLEPWHCL